MTRADKKQIPQKVLYEDVGYDQYRNVNIYACICSSCRLHIIRFDDTDVLEIGCDDAEKMFHENMVHHAYIGLNNYCNRCGQKLKWKVREKDESNNRNQRRDNGQDIRTIEYCASL